MDTCLWMWMKYLMGQINLSSITECFNCIIWSRFEADHSAATRIYSKHPDSECNPNRFRRWTRITTVASISKSSWPWAWSCSPNKQSRVSRNYSRLWTVMKTGFWQGKSFVRAWTSSSVSYCWIVKLGNCLFIDTKNQGRSCPKIFDQQISFSL